MIGNVNLVKNRNATSISRSWIYKEITIDELIRWYGMWMMIESTYGNNTSDLRSHFKQIKTTENVQMGFDRFQAIYHSLQPSLNDFEIIVDLLHTAFMKYLYF